MSKFPSFPCWLGKNSSAGKHSRIVQELASHMSLKSVLVHGVLHNCYWYKLKHERLLAVGP